MAPLGELSDLGGDDGKALPVFAGAGSLNGRIEREQVGLVSDLLNDGNFLRDGFHGVDRFGDGLAGLLHVVGALDCGLFHLPGVRCVLCDRRMHLFEARTGFLHGSGLFAGSARQFLCRQ